MLAGNYAAQLGSQTENRYAYSSVRQTITVPPGRPRTVISFWTYTWAEALSGSDEQQFLLLGPGDQVWAKPWATLEDAQAWEQHVFDVIGAGGLTFDLYFNVRNDGRGGRTAMFLDEVQAWACTPNSYPEELLLAESSAMQQFGVTQDAETPWWEQGTPAIAMPPTGLETETTPVAPERTPPALQEAAAAGPTPTFKVTTVSIITPTPPPPTMTASPTPSATASITPAPAQELPRSEVGPTGMLGRLREMLSEGADRLRLAVILILVVILALIFVFAWQVQQSSR